MLKITLTHIFFYNLSYRHQKSFRTLWEVLEIILCAIMYNIERLQTRFEHGFEVQKLSTNQWRSCSRSFPKLLLTRGQSPGWLKNILIKKLENLKKARKAQGKDFRRLLSLDFENISGAQSLPQSATNGLEVNHKAICSHSDSSVQAENFSKPWEGTETDGYSARPVQLTANVGWVCLLTFLA